MPMTREQAKDYVRYVVDDAGAGRRLGSDMHAIVREAGGEFKYASRLVGWIIGGSMAFVAVHSYLDVAVKDDEAESMAAEYLAEIGFFVGPVRMADFVL